MAQKKATKAQPEGRVVAGAAVMTSHGGLGADRRLAKDIETAMSQAITDALAEGIIDPDEQRRRMLAARDQVRVSRGAILAPTPQAEQARGARKAAKVKTARRRR
jgi:hypothetical protein